SADLDDSHTYPGGQFSDRVHGEEVVSTMLQSRVELKLGQRVAADLGQLVLDLPTGEAGPEVDRRVGRIQVLSTCAARNMGCRGLVVRPSRTTPLLASTRLVVSGSLPS